MREVKYYFECIEVEFITLIGIPDDARGFWNSTFSKILDGIIENLTSGGGLR